ncbi:YitT family protein [Domibacillus epiphyticus]|uniref:YitT family protein n=1 Tax=Domibacillus epiphyticus TaxID=1714355 RepID=A0A1V2A8E9_9BACI|nr:YitT family protein [Domibacillus epiphyticus]OMP67200.1 hypothetical protein BTO28_07660 [Domibacillus epiphyticus]
MPFVHKTISIIIGSLLLGIGVNVFLVPYELLDGGTIGVGLIVHYLTGIKIGFVVIMMSIPIFLIAWFYNRSYFYNSLHGMMFSSFMIDVLYPIHTFGNDLYFSPFTNALLGGIFVGSGIGTMLRYDTSIGGTDLFGQMVAKHLKVNPGIIIFIIDFFIISIGSIVFSIGSLLLCLMTVICVGFMTSLISRKNRQVNH